MQSVAGERDPKDLLSFEGTDMEKVNSGVPL
jgi:hypothetical protein